MQMRTIKQLADHYKALDPETALTKSAIRRLIISGAVPHTMAGSKYLVAVEAFEDYLQHGDTQNSQPVPVNGIRKVVNKYGT